MSQSTRLPSALSSQRTTAAQNTVPIDPALIDDVEKHAQEISDDLAVFMGKLRSRLDEMTAATSQSVSLTTDSARNLSTAVHESVAETSELINTVGSMKNEMVKVKALAGQIKSLKDNLDWLEAVVGKG
ncbi:uncharacterized protein EV422DRAFT_598114 [Fimicolochytrium jonesii]|uniref:uncharacterized protein n=1 Tax=Fimicolochytrium jonesii TaxID=1396493 RepID=UPI0022FEA6F2|nr:uncharacterized protein EV422DRAFT_598114 [Fimicolochytrium jonesii]KAI8819606.1 hypothetical protein EV422DRAFT_598114 [Fimicolochytrium jonesii]